MSARIFKFKLKTKTATADRCLTEKKRVRILKFGPGPENLGANYYFTPETMDRVRRVRRRMKLKRGKDVIGKSVVLIDFISEELLEKESLVIILRKNIFNSVAISGEDMVGETPKKTPS
jgi:hypothetical protein